MKSETNLDYYDQTLNVKVVSQVAEWHWGISKFQEIIWNAIALKTKFWEFP